MNQIHKKKEAVTIQISFGQFSEKQLKLGREFMIITAFLTFVSAVWGVGAASWSLWTHISGSDSDKASEQAHLVASEVNRFISEQGVLAPSEKGLLNHIRDQIEQFATSKLWASGPSVVTEAKDNKTAQNSVDSREVELSSQINADTVPTVNFDARNNHAELPMVIEAMSYYSLKTGSIVRVELGNTTGKTVKGSIVGQAKYLVDGREVVVKMGDHPDAPIDFKNGILFRSKIHVTKHFSLKDPAGQDVHLTSIQIGFFISRRSPATFSDWFVVPGSNTSSSQTAQN